MSDSICTSRMPQNSEQAFHVCIDSDQNRTIRELLKTLYRELHFPEDDVLTLDGCLDWITDLSWIEQKEIQILFLNSDVLLSDELFFRQLFLTVVEEDVIPFWNEQAENVFDENDRKNITFYFVQQ